MSYGGTAAVTGVFEPGASSMCSNGVAAGARSVRGARRRNEDAVLCEPALGLFAVADGMGGHEGGATASRLAVQAVADHFVRFHEDPDATWPFATACELPLEENMVDAAFRQAHHRIERHRQGRRSRMGTTLAVLYLGDEHAVVGHIGDSRVYHLSAGTLTQLTRDHSLYEKMRDRGITDLPPIERYPLAHVITRALGMPEDDGRPELVRVARRPGDAFLLCTDGLSGSATSEKLTRGLLSEDGPDEACEALVDTALSAGSKDNVTAVIVRPRAPNEDSE